MGVFMSIISYRLDGHTLYALVTIIDGRTVLTPCDRDGRPL